VLLGLENSKMAAVAMVTMKVVFLNCPIVITPKATPSDNQHNDDEDRFDISVLPDFGD
jgi:hypothetical protein